MIVLLMLALVTSVHNIVVAQENARRSVSPFLIKCYNESRLRETEYRLPATMETLIALIRKIEDNIHYSSNRELGPQLLFSFRQDGITRSTRANLPSEYGIPYSPKQGYSSKNIVLLSKVIPKVPSLDTSVLTDLEQCSLHYILSKSIDYSDRGDDQTVCNQIGKYRVRHTRRTLVAEQVEKFSTELDTASACPVELGVVYSKWGAISAGDLIAGIAAGFNPQQIPINGSSQKLDSRYAATIVGDFAEAALYQISNVANGAIQIGAEGNWNSTIEPKWYFVNRNRFLQMTDSEIRGGLDGLYLGLSTSSIIRSFPDIKLSQIIDLYYSQRGVFNSSLRACNRKALETSFTNTDQLISQTSYFENLLDPVALLESSIDPKKYKDLAALAVNSFNNYLPNNLNDALCSQDNDNITRAASDLTIFLDVGFEYSRMQPLISYLLENIDVNRFDSKYTIYNAKTAEPIVNSSITILDYHQMFNESVWKLMQPGSDFRIVLDKIESMEISKLINQTNSGGRSSVYLIVTKDTPSQSDSVASRTKEWKHDYPDLRILILGTAEKTYYKDYVINTDSDVFVMPDTTNSNLVGSEAQLKTTMNGLVRRIKHLPRSIINPKCGVVFDSSVSGGINLNQNVEPHGINYYKLSPNYFFNHDDSPMLKVTGQGYGSLEVCLVRFAEGSQTDSTILKCSSINNDVFSYNINGICGDTFSECDPVFLSVTGISSNNRCNDDDCRFPDNIKFTISLENVKCYNSVGHILPSLSLTIFVLCSYLRHLI